MPNAKFILQAAAEVSPVAKVGGLADVVGSLPPALKQLGLRSDVIIPWYASVARKLKATPVGHFTVRLGDTSERATLVKAKLGSFWLYGIKHRFFSGSSIYQPSGTVQTTTDVERFTFFSRAVVASIEAKLLSPDLIHCHDWHAGLVPTFLDYSAVHYGLPFIPTVFTIHNIAHQGQQMQVAVDQRRLAMNLELAVLEDSLDDDQINIMKIAILTADRLTTVSPSYAHEILKSEESAGLSEFLRRRRRHLSGILNGLDYTSFNPQSDTFLTQKYSIKNYKKGKQANRQSLLRQFNLPDNGNLLFGMVTRLVEQKGLDLVLRAWPKMAQEKIQLIILGLGNPVYEQALQKLSRQYPDQLALKTSFDLRLAQHIYAGSDAFLMPSRFEPCGLGQMIAMRYGTIPLVRKTGGLKDSVKHGYSGIVFNRYEPSALTTAVRQMTRLYQRPASWYTMVKRDMSLDFSWDQSAKKYIKLYQALL